MRIGLLVPVSAALLAVQVLVQVPVPVPVPVQVVQVLGLLTTGWNASGSGATLSAALNFLTSTTDGHIPVISGNPRILTLNNQTALIQISTGSKWRVSQADVVTTSTTGNVTTYTPQRYTTGVVLEVTIHQANLLTKGKLPWLFLPQRY